MDNFIKSYKEKGASETNPTSLKEECASETSPIKEAKKEEEIMSTDEYPTMEMKEKTTRYKLALD